VTPTAGVDGAATHVIAAAAKPDQRHPPAAAHSAALDTAHAAGIGVQAHVYADAEAPVVIEQPAGAASRGKLLPAHASPAYPSAAAPPALHEIRIDVVELYGAQRPTARTCTLIGDVASVLLHADTWWFALVSTPVSGAEKLPGVHVLYSLLETDASQPAVVLTSYGVPEHAADDE
jgi:hypothetical protein